jgi:hypothetical protein
MTQPGCSQHPESACEWHTGCQIRSSENQYQAGSISGGQHLAEESGPEQRESGGEVTGKGGPHRAGPVDERVIQDKRWTGRDRESHQPAGACQPGARVHVAAANGTRTTAVTVIADEAVTSGGMLGMTRWM